MRSRSRCRIRYQGPHAGRDGRLEEEEGCELRLSWFIDIFESENGKHKTILVIFEGVRGSVSADELSETPTKAAEDLVPSKDGSQPGAVPGTKDGVKDGKVKPTGMPLLDRDSCEISQVPSVSNVRSFVLIGITFRELPIR